MESGSSPGSVVSGWGSRLATLVAVASVGAIAAAFLLSPDSDRPGSPRSGAAEVDVTKLVASTTKARLPRAPRDTEPRATTAGDVVHPKRTLPVYAEPDGRPFAKVTPNQMGETWLPVIDRRPGWVQVLLPSRPNGSTGWLKTSSVEQARTPYLIRVHVGSRELELFSDGELLGHWPVAVGTAETPTPTGRTFLLGSIVDAEQSYSPVILPLGSHSDTLDSYGGGPGTVAIHGWPDDSVFGNAVSHGCIRVPDDALEQLTQVPLGTLVLIDDN
ncbi:L,D-transpeptidase family protein [Nocardioides sp. HM23]|uniref:L,D-transpeptidase n=1 Tax=Nocardioides bizhenqiangii TaxID=3095076 RepID=UPI002ACA1909|nr:L,D-transpeptidase family protein [Nocardioides sp. HM23]MDZ5621510.1 L,D-transpeptidase family protein [Nocardioides sp. HM23]